MLRIGRLVIGLLAVVFLFVFVENTQAQVTGQALGGGGCAMAAFGEGGTAAAIGGGGCGGGTTSAPIVSIVSPQLSVNTRKPLVIITYQPGGSQPNDTINIGSVVIKWGTTDVTALGRSNKRIWEWEVSDLHRYRFPGETYKITATACNFAGDCSTKSRFVTLAGGNQPIISVQPMPLEALGRRFSAPLAGGFSIDGVAARTNVSVPSYTSRGVARSTGLTYSTRQSFPRAIVTFDMEFPAGTPTSATARMLMDGVALDSATVASPACSEQDPCRVSLEEGLHLNSYAPATRKWVRVEVKATYPGGNYTSVDSVEIVLTDRRETPYGSGWWPTGVMRLVTSGSDAILVSSDGTGTIYRGHVSNYISPPGNYSTLTKNGTGWLLNLRGGGMIFFDSQGRQTSSVDAIGNQTGISYSGAEQVSAITDPAGKSFNFSYVGGVLSTITDPGGRASSFTINTLANFELTRFNPASNPGHATFVDFGWYNNYQANSVLPNYVQNAQGKRTTFLYWNALLHEATLPSVANEFGVNVTPSVRVDAPEVSTLRNIRPSSQQAAAIVNGLGDTVWSRFNRWGGTTTAWDALGLRSLNSFNDIGQLLVSEGPGGDSSRTYNTYDADGHLVRTYRLRSDGSILRLDSIVYNSNHHVIEKVDTYGNRTVFVRNVAGQLLKMYQDLGDTLEYFYRTGGLIDSTRSARSGRTTYNYDPVWSNVWQVRGHGNELRSETSYDSFGRPTESRSCVTVQAATGVSQKQWRRRVQTYLPNSNLPDVTRFERTDNVATCTTPNWPLPTDPVRTATTVARYDQWGRRTGATRANGSWDFSEFDAWGRVVTHYPYQGHQQTGPSETFKYDVAGNLRFKTTRAGDVLETRYDSRGRVDLRIIPGVGTYQYSYNGPNEELTGITVANYQDPVGGVNPNVSWTYNLSGQVQTEVAANGWTTDYTYDTDYRVATYADTSGTYTVRYHGQLGVQDSLHTPQNNWIRYEWDEFGRVNGPFVTGADKDFERTQTWRTNGGLFTVTNRAQSNQASQWFDAAVLDLGNQNPVEGGQVDSLAPVWTEQHGFGGTTYTMTDSVTYDGWGRVTRVAHTSGPGAQVESFSYDNSGNLSFGASEVFDNRNRITSNLNCTFTHDEAGRMTGRNCGGMLWVYEYDALDRMVRVLLNSAVVASYAYDALGQRVAKKVGSTITRFHWRAGHVVNEQDDNSVYLHTFVWGFATDDLVYLQRKDFNNGAVARRYVVQDRIRSVRGIITRAGLWTKSYRYGAYGRFLSQSGSEGAWAERFRWAGAQYDPETGFYFMRARYYDPEIGRFISEDPLGDAVGTNRYSYVDGDPMTKRDPSGMVASIDAQYQAVSDASGVDDNNPGYIPFGGGGGGGFDPWDARGGFEDWWLERMSWMLGVVEGAIEGLDPRALSSLRNIAVSAGVSVYVSASARGNRCNNISRHGCQPFALSADISKVRGIIGSRDWIDIGQYDRETDTGVFNQRSLPYVVLFWQAAMGDRNVRGLIGPAGAVFRRSADDGWVENWNSYRYEVRQAHRFNHIHITWGF